jgi:deazaflavin-dependent oxidoreductase (nitroreductase family)
MSGNGFISWVLRSPLHGMLSNGMMLITVTGCKTGKKYTTPVGYFRQNGDLWVLTSRDRTWWKNLQNGAEVSLLLKREYLHAVAKPELNSKAVESLMCQYIKHIPQAARSMGIRVEHGTPNLEDIARATKDRLFVRISLS